MRIGPRFFETLGINVIAGREFDVQDERPGGPDSGAPRTAIINEKLARRYFGDVNPLGKRFYSPGQPEQKFEIVGLVKDAKHRSL